MQSSKSSRWFAGFLAALMCLSCLPAAALADAEPAAEPLPVEAESLAEEPEDAAETVPAEEEAAPEAEDPAAEEAPIEEAAPAAEEAFAPASMGVAPAVDYVGDGASAATAAIYESVAWTSATIDGVVRWAAVNNADGTYIYGWASIDGEVYYFGSDGYAAIGVVTIDGKLYCFWSGGKAALDSWYNTDDGDWYYVKTDTGCVTGLQWIDSDLYFFSSTGVMQKNCFQTVDGRLYYFWGGGRAAGGGYWFELPESSGNWYYTDEECVIQTGLSEVDGKYYFFESDGRLAGAGWHALGEALYYTDSAGVAKTGGYARRDGVWYHLTVDGAVRDDSITGDYLAVYELTDPEFGVIADDGVSDNAAINALMTQAARLPNPDNKQILILVPAGTYNLTGTIMIFSNMTLKLDKDAVIQRNDPDFALIVGAHMNGDAVCPANESCTHGGYTQFRNVCISGGVWDGGASGSSADSLNAVMFGFAHGSGLTIRDTTLQNDRSMHMLILDAMEDVVIDNVTFLNEYLFTGIDTSYHASTKDRALFTDAEWSELAFSKETVALDFANAAGSNSYPLDNTGCRNITVKNCCFTNILAGVGSHHEVEGLAMEGVYILDNTFNGVRSAVVDAFSIHDLVVSGNIVNGAGEFMDASGSRGELSGNRVSDISYAVWSIGSTFTLDGESYSIDDALGFEKPAVRVIEGSDVTMTDCTIENASQGGVLVSDASAAALSGVTVSGAGKLAAIVFNGSRGSAAECTLTGAADYGVNVVSSDGVEVRDNSACGFAKSGVLVTDSKNITVKGNTVTDSVAGPDIALWRCTGSTVSENTVSTSAAEDIRFDGDGVTSSGNKAKNPKTGWEKKEDGWHYYIDGDSATGWQKIGGAWYYFSSTGKMADPGWLNLYGTFYYMNGSGALYYGWLQDGGNWYYFGAGGRMVTGWQLIGSAWYYFWGGGSMHTGWLNQSGTYYYLTPGGAMAVGWQKVDGKWYCFASDGKMLTGWQKLGGVWYYLGNNGVMASGWQYIGGAYYYFEPSGAMHTGWLKDDGYWYYFGAGGALVTGWQKVGSAWYYFWGSGKMADPGWLNLDGSFYYLNESGALYYGWLQDGGSWYYFGAGGKMVTGWQKVGSAWYYFWGGGNMHTGWLNLSGVYYYFNASGAMVTGQQTIDGVSYTFSASGAWIS